MHKARVSSFVLLNLSSPAAAFGSSSRHAHTRSQERKENGEGALALCLCTSPLSPGQLGLTAAGAQPQTLTQSSTPIFGGALITVATRTRTPARANPHIQQQRKVTQTYTTTAGVHKPTHALKYTHTLSCAKPIPIRLPSYYLSTGSKGEMQMFFSLKIESVTEKLRAIFKN